MTLQVMNKWILCNNVSLAHILLCIFLFYFSSLFSWRTSHQFFSLVIFVCVQMSVCSKLMPERSWILYVWVLWVLVNLYHWLLWEACIIDILCWYSALPGTMQDFIQVFMIQHLSVIVVTHVMFSVDWGSFIFMTI